MTHHHLPFLTVVAVRTALVLGWLFLGLRLLGKRHVSPMNVCDLAFIMALANAVQNAMTNGKGDLSVGVASAGTLLFLGWLATRLFLRMPSLEARIIGTPTVLIHDGHIEKRNMRREHVTMRELMQAIRSHDLTDSCEVHLAVLEVDGNINIVPKETVTD